MTSERRVPVRGRTTPSLEVTEEGTKGELLGGVSTPDVFRMTGTADRVYRAARRLCTSIVQYCLWVLLDELTESEGASEETGEDGGALQEGDLTHAIISPIAASAVCGLSNSPDRYPARLSRWEISSDQMKSTGLTDEGCINTAFVHLVALGGLSVRGGHFQHRRQRE